MKITCNIELSTGSRRSRVIVKLSLSNNLLILFFSKIISSRVKKCVYNHVSKMIDPGLEKQFVKTLKNAIRCKILLDRPNVSVNQALGLRPFTFTCSRLGNTEALRALVSGSQAHLLVGGLFFNVNFCSFKVRLPTSCGYPISPALDTTARVYSIGICIHRSCLGNCEDRRLNDFLAHWSLGIFALPFMNVAFFFFWSFCVSEWSDLIYCTLLRK